MATPIIRDGNRFFFIKLNLFFASQVSKKNIIFSHEEKKSKVYFGKIQTGQKIFTANTIVYKTSTLVSIFTDFQF